MPVDSQRGVGDRIGQALVSCSHVVQRTVRFDMPETRARRSGDAGQRTDLIRNQVLDLLRCRL